MTQITAIRNGLVAALDPVPNLNPYKHVKGVINLPAGGVAAVVQRRITRYDSTYQRGSDDFEFTVMLFAEFGDHDLAFEAMDPYLDGSGDKSIKQAIEADESLGGAVHFARVREAQDERVTTYDNVDYLTVDVIVDITASGTE